MSRNLVITLVVVVVLVVIGWYLMNRSQKTAVTPSPEATPMASNSASPKASASDSAMMGKMTELKVSGGDFSFTPSNLSVKAGEKVMITFQNNGKFPHNLTIDKLGIATKTIGPGQSDTVEFTPDQKGTFAIYCSVDAHRQKGMEGTIQVQ